MWLIWASLRENLSLETQTGLLCFRSLVPWSLEILNIESTGNIQSRQQKQMCWSDCTYAQTDLHLCCLHMAYDRFSDDEAHFTAIKTGNLKIFWQENVFNIFFHVLESQMNTYYLKCEKNSVCVSNIRLLHWYRWILSRVGISKDLSL